SLAQLATSCRRQRPAQRHAIISGMECASIRDLDWEPERPRSNAANSIADRRSSRWHDGLWPDVSVDRAAPRVRSACSGKWAAGFASTTSTASGALLNVRRAGNPLPHTQRFAVITRLYFRLMSLYTKTRASGAIAVPRSEVHSRQQPDVLRKGA